ncbi:ComEC/Rec2 family competence protein [uncultured Clostridium sp.]|uniref:ComEC/Rec2 family competence protein n=1 Tax=uncultured Clostridium sp. TaxID=59620 RepID=UPI0025E850E7|nr:ComEC/Rec2 family competence protein [uncultured Clostridium sp.]
MKKHKGNKRAQLATVIIFGTIALCTVIFEKDYIGEFINNHSSNSTVVEGTMEVSYLDVGQGDSAYIRVNDFDILIDAGPKSDSDRLLEQLKAKNIDDFEMIIATHPHEDHIGGMADVFQQYDVESFYMPSVTHTTKTFENMVKAVSNEGIKIQTIKEGMKFDLGTGAKIDVYSPIYESYEEFNDYSPIMKLTFGETELIFTGDAEAHAEADVVAKYPDNLKADVLKFGHHGSSTSSTEEFLQSVSPEYGIISCGADNKYGHPHRETLDKISKYNIKSYRTDTQGQITLTSDGKNISIKTEK